MFYSSGRPAIFEGPSPRRDEYLFFVGNGGELKKVKDFYEKFSLEKFHGYQSIHENHETFPPRTIYAVCMPSGLQPCAIASCVYN